MKNVVVYTILFFALLCSCVSAIPTNDGVSLVSSNNFTISCGGTTGDVWVRYGESSWAKLAYMTANSTSSTITVAGAPLTASTTYKWTCCDSTGCNAVPGTVTTGTLVVQPRSTLGATMDNLVANRMKVELVGPALVEPYLWGVFFDAKDLGLTILFFLIFLAFYAGLWLRTRDVSIPVIAGLVIAPLVMFSDTGLHLGLPVEAQAIAQALFYASLTGVVLAFLKK